MAESVSKSSLRQEMRSALKQFDPASREMASRQIVEHLARWEKWPTFHRIHAFYPLPSEPNLRLGDWSGKRLALPRISNADLNFHEVPGFESLEVHAWGMAEPAAESPMAPLPNLILVPGLGFDRAGNRLGRGAGFYDRFLTTLPHSVLRIGIGFEIQVRDSIPTEPHDVRLDGLITERGASFFATPRSSP